VEIRNKLEIKILSRNDSRGSSLDTKSAPASSNIRTVAGDGNRGGSCKIMEFERTPTSYFCYPTSISSYRGTLDFHPIYPLFIIIIILFLLGILLLLLLL